MAGTLDICRICLTVNVRMFSLKTTNLEMVYELITQGLVKDDGKPETVCYLCYARLKRCARFRQLAVKSNEVLKQLLHNGLLLATSNSAFKNLYSNQELQITPTYHLYLEPVASEDVSLTQEQVQVLATVEEGKESLDCETQALVVTIANDNDGFPDDAEHTDSEDDLPLIAIGSKNGVILPSHEVKKKRKKEDSELVITAKEIELSPEEQRVELLARASSENYTNSPYKCDKCYKGFIHPQAFNNHMMKHDKSSGDHECAVCTMRYNSVRQLRAHEMSAHARRYECDKCPHRAHTRHQARDHEKWHNGHTYPCKLCGQKFQKPTSYLTHLRKHHSEHSCTLCGEGFVGRHGLLMHRSKAHRGQEVDLPILKDADDEEAKKSFCADCNIQFLTRDAWTRHQLTSFKHTSRNESSPNCLICGEQVSPSRRASHLREHARGLRPPQEKPPTPKPTLPCPQCGVRFASRSGLVAHSKRVHLGLKEDRSLVCELCGDVCKSKAALQSHQRRHSGERPFACAQCAARFAERGRLLVHLRTHSGERPYACAQCPRTFAQRPALNRHRRVHSGARPYACPLCQRRFAQSNSLKLHERCVHLKLKRPQRPLQSQAVPS